jgi:signal transduction histidine kinase
VETTDHLRMKGTGNSRKARVLNDVFVRTAHPLLVLDRDGAPIIANPAAVELLGLTDESRWDRSAWMAGLQPQAAEVLRECLEDVLSGRTSESGPVRTTDERSMLSFEMFPLPGGTREKYAVAIVFDRMEDVEERYLHEAVRRLQAAIDPLPDTATMLDRIVERVCKDLGAEGAGILSREGGRWSVTFASGLLERGRSFDDEEARRLFPSLLDGETRVLEDLSDDACEDLPEPIPRNIKAAIVAPLRLQDGIGGAIICTFGHSMRFSPSHIDYVQIAGALASLALKGSQAQAGERSDDGLLQYIVDSLPANIALVHYPGMELTLVNEGFRKYIGDVKSLNELLSMKQEDLRERVIGVLEKVHRTGEPYKEREMPVHTRSGETLYWDAHIVPYPTSSGDRILVMMNDITDQVEGRKRVEDLVRYADLERVRLQTVLETLPVAIMVVDKGGNILMANDTLRSFIDPTDVNILVDLPQLEGRWTETGETIGEEEWPILRALRGERISGLMSEVRAKDGKVRTIIGSASPIMAEGEINGAVIAFYDVTERRAAELDAMISRSKMELYLDLLSHDINNLNTSAKGYLELLMWKGGLDERALHLTRSSSALLDDVARLVENVRKLQKAEAEAMDRSPIDLWSLIDGVVASYGDIPSSRARISFQPGERLMVMGNPLLRDVFDNLVGNAVKHSGGDVDIEIDVGRYISEGKEFVRVDITDTGPGIPDDIKEKLFERMERGHTTARGHGLGLYLARTVLEMIGGCIWAEDRVPGDHTKGARFVVLVPPAEPQGPDDA